MMLDFLFGVAAEPAQTVDVIEAMKSVQVFYEQAWVKLLWVVGVTGGVAILVMGIVGAAIPLWLHWQRSKAFALKEKELFDKIAAAEKDLRADIHDIMIMMHYTRAKELVGEKQEWMAVDMAIFAASGSLLLHPMRDANDKLDAFNRFIAQLLPTLPTASGSSKGMLPLYAGAIPGKLQTLITSMRERGINDTRIGQWQKLHSQIIALIPNLTKRWEEGTHDKKDD